MFNLKQILMELGNKLVQQHGYDPATVPNPHSHSTHKIKDFTEFMNNSPEARVALRELGGEWPMVAAVPAKPSKTDLFQRRLQIAEGIFSEHEFGPDNTVKDTENWQTDEWGTLTCVYYLENPDDEPSRRCQFKVLFDNNSIKILEIDAGN